MEQTAPRKVGIGAYIALIFAVIFFSGITVSDYAKKVGTAFAESIGVEPKSVHNVLSVLDFNTLNGKFGSVIVPDGKGTMAVEDSKGTDGKSALGKGNFTGKEGAGARDGFLFALTLIPAIMFSVGMIAVLEHYGALEAMRLILQKILRPLMGVPGHTGLAMIASFQSTDAGAALTRNLYDGQQITAKERDIFAMFQFSAGAVLGNFLGSGVGLLALTATIDGQLQGVPVSIGLCLAVMFVFKFFGANLMRLYLNFIDRKQGDAA